MIAESFVPMNSFPDEYASKVSALILKTVVGIVNTRDCAVIYQPPTVSHIDFLDLGPLLQDGIACCIFSLSGV